MFGITLTDISKADVHRQLSVLLPNSVRRAEVSGINRSLTTVRAALSREVRRDVALKSKTVKDAMKFQKARYSQSRPEAEIHVDRKVLPLSQFGANHIRSGVSYRILKRGSRKKISSGFQVSAYRGEFFKRVGAARGPLKLLTGPSVGGALNARRDTMHGAINDIVAKRIEERIQYEIHKLLR